MPIPSTVRDEIVSAVTIRADNHDYMHRDRNENRIFIQALTTDPNIGGRLADFMGRDRVRTYIKDSILNAYAKKKNYGAKSPDYITALSISLGSNFKLVDSIGSKRTPLIIARSGSGGHVIAKVGTVLKWETAVRHCAEFVVRTNRLNHSTDVQLVVLLQGANVIKNAAEQALLVEAALVLGIKAIII